MDYQTSLDYLNSLAFKGIKLGLGNIKKILSHLEDPHLKIPSIHIAGTNGKGSTAAYVESILRASGFRVGLFTSPHFLDFSERIQIDRVPISKSDFASNVSAVKGAIRDLKAGATYFEFATILAFLYFSKKKPDWVVLEVGLGGRLDCTNVCKPEVSIISSISMDHQAYLGNTIESIAFEKASIIKKSGTVIAEKQEERVEKVILDFAKSQKAAIRFREKDYFVTRRRHSWESQTFDFQSNYGSFKLLKTHLLGLHQLFNAGMAIESILSLKEKGYLIKSEAIYKGILNCQWEGRLEVVEQKPFLVLDSAHNIDSVNFLTKAIKEHFQYNKCIIVLGVMKDKDIEKIGLTLLEFADKIILTKPNNERSADPADLKKVLSKMQKPIEIIEEIQYSVGIAKKLANPEDLICITGSLFTIAEAKLFLNNEENS
jgi:dihydrofolate synthase / folylpolyglutamate synthase